MTSRDATPSEPAFPPDGDPTGIAPGDRVTVTPVDNARVPVDGILVAADTQEIVIRRDSAETGTLHIHFPRAGFAALPVADGSSRTAA